MGDLPKIRVRVIVKVRIEVRFRAKKIRVLSVTGDVTQSRLYGRLPVFDPLPLPTLV